MAEPLRQKNPADPRVAARRRWMAILARADAEEISVRLAACPALPGWRVLRGPDSGLVMVSGRTGGGGAPFNLGEMTVTRCTIRTGSGQDGFTGHAYVAGRDGKQAELAAVVDALLQDPTWGPVLMDTVIKPLAGAQQARRDAIAAKAAATKVQFFAMQNMRGS
jgi:alpha-D-ribose 1-methylphosphonate 5-triphosphate synthase subunit PhnG